MEPRGRERPASDLDTAVTLSVLDAVDENSRITQRDLAKELGIALGLANAYLKRCIGKGWIKVTQIPANRYAYYLTPQGFSEKSRLAAEYLTYSFSYFRRARTECEMLMGDAVARGWSRFAFAGCSELTEIAALCAPEGAHLIAVMDDRRAGTHFAGLPVIAGDIPDEADAVMITDLATPQATFDRLSRLMPVERLLTPRMLKISRRRPESLDED